MASPKDGGASSSSRMGRELEVGNSSRRIHGPGYRGGVLARAFTCVCEEDQLPLASLSLPLDPVTVSEVFNSSGAARSPFRNGGVAIGGSVYTAKLLARHAGRKKLLRHVLIEESKVPPEYRVARDEEIVWETLEGAKSLQRKKRNGVVYTYDEGPIPFPDSIDRPARTIVTGEGGRSPSRFKHVIRFGKSGYRRLTPVELERLNGFRSNHTRLPGLSDSRRAFFMGNALVTGIVTKIATQIAEMDVLGDADEPLGDDVKDAAVAQMLNGTTNHVHVQGKSHRRLASP